MFGVNSQASGILYRLPQLIFAPFNFLLSFFFPPCSFTLPKQPYPPFLIYFCFFNTLKFDWINMNILQLRSYTCTRFDSSVWLAINLVRFFLGSLFKSRVTQFLGFFFITMSCSCIRGGVTKVRLALYWLGYLNIPWQPLPNHPNSGIIFFTYCSIFIWIET